MNAQELERRFLGNFVHTLPMDEQAQWLAAQPEIECALHAKTNDEDWMTTPFAAALSSVCSMRAVQAEQAAECERIANLFTIDAVLSEAALPDGILVHVSPREISRHERLTQPVTVEFVNGTHVLARYRIDPRQGHGKTCAAYKKFVRDHLAARLAHTARTRNNE